jgi:nucleoside-diphosphate kinase
VVAMVVSGPNAIGAIRYVVGDTDPLKAQPGTIRGEYAVTVCKNIVHSSDSVKTAKKEISRFFKPAEILAYHLDYEKEM